MQEPVIDLVTWTCIYDSDSPGVCVHQAPFPGQKHPQHAVHSVKAYLNNMQVGHRAPGMDGILHRIHQNWIRILSVTC